MLGWRDFLPLLVAGAVMFLLWLVSAGIGALLSTRDPSAVSNKSLLGRNAHQEQGDSNPNFELPLQDWELFDLDAMRRSLHKSSGHPMMPRPSYNGEFGSVLLPFLYYENSPVQQILEPFQNEGNPTV
jgi:hypothetical protein